MARRRQGSTGVGLAAAVMLGILAAGCSRGDPDSSSPAASTASAAPAAAQDPVLTVAATQYRDYVVAEAAALQSSTRAFTDAVRAGDVARAKALYAPARMHYEDIESVVESVGDLDDDIDARIDGVADPSTWIGFHRIERALWLDGSLVGMAPYANELDLDVFTLKARVATARFEPADLADRACDLLATISTTTISGEEDRYAHTDLWDLAANVAGAHTAFELLRPALEARDPALARRIEARFADVTAELDRHRQQAGYVDWSTVPQPQLRSLSDAVDALAEPMSQIGATLTRAAR